MESSEADDFENLRTLTGIACTSEDGGQRRGHVDIEIAFCLFAKGGRVAQRVIAVARELSVCPFNDSSSNFAAWSKLPLDQRV